MTWHLPNWQSRMHQYGYGIGYGNTAFSKTYVSQYGYRVSNTIQVQVSDTALWVKMEYPGIIAGGPYWQTFQINGYEPSSIDLKMDSRQAPRPSHTRNTQSLLPWVQKIINQLIKINKNRRNPIDTGYVAMFVDH